MPENIIPSVKWMKYAALRLGTFIMCYFTLVACTAVALSFAGIGVGLGLILALLPIAVFIAIRISGSLTRSRNPDNIITKEM